MAQGDQLEIEKFVKKSKYKFKIKISISKENAKKLLGTGGAIKKK